MSTTAPNEATPSPTADGWAAVAASTVAVAAFQLRRLLTRPRLLLAGVGIVFPAAVMLAVRRTATWLDRDFTVMMLFVLVPEAVCMLGLLVTMSPVVADELERGTWIHVAVRPGGRRALLLGTFLAAVAWTSVVAVAAVVAALAVAGTSHPAGLVAMFAALVLLSTAGRAALFSLPAVILPKRALVASVGIALVVEFLCGLLPAVVNQATVSLRLRSLLAEWMGWRRNLPTEIEMLVDPAPAWVQVGAVVVLVITLLTAAVLIVERRQFPPSEEA